MVRDQFSELELPDTERFKPSKKKGPDDDEEASSDVPQGIDTLSREDLALIAAKHKLAQVAVRKATEESLPPPPITPSALGPEVYLG